MDADEFYREKELSFAKQYIKDNNILSSSVTSYFHLKEPIYRSKDSTCCAFITKLSKHLTIGGNEYFIDNVDPTRKLLPAKSWSEKLITKFFPKCITEHYHFSESQVAMYHMNFVRKDNMRSKLNNTSTTDKNFLDLVYKAVNE